MRFEVPPLVHVHVTRDVVRQLLHATYTCSVHASTMKIVEMKQPVLFTFIGVALVSLGCSTFDPENQSTQIATSTDNVEKIKCGARIYEVPIDKLTAEQRDQLKEFKTRCRIDNVAHNLEMRSGSSLDWLDSDYNVSRKSKEGI